MTSGLDTEDGHSLLDEALRKIGAVVRSHGRTVVRYQGDGFKAVFGLPLARRVEILRAKGINTRLATRPEPIYYRPRNKNNRSGGAGTSDWIGNPVVLGSAGCASAESCADGFPGQTGEIINMSI